MLVINSENKKPIFSVIIPTFNRGKVIRRSIDSVLKQTFTDIELIVIDDGSNDNTESVVKDFHDSRLHYLKNEKNEGANHARNMGIRVARGKYFSFLDSDDEWLPNKLLRVYEKFLSDEEIGCVYDRAGILDNQGKIVPIHEDILEGYIYKEALTKGYITSMSFLSVKRECFDVLGGFDESFTHCQDDEICLRLASAFKFGLIPEVLGIYHTDAEDRMGDQKNSRKIALSWQRLFDKFSKDVVYFCGKDVLSRHYANCGRRFASVGDRKNAIKAFIRSLQNNFRWENFFYLIQIFFPLTIVRYANRFRFVLGKVKKKIGELM